MSQYIDSYYLINSRNLEIINDFFSKYLPLGLEELAIDYSFPEYSDNPERIYNSAKELLKHLEENLGVEYIVYFKNKDILSDIKQVILQYTDDGKLIFGISIVGNNPALEENLLLLKEIKKYLNSKNACATIEEPPPTNSIDFIEFCDGRYRI
jgi:hypothetical protein